MSATTTSTSGEQRDLGLGTYQAAVVRDPHAPLTIERVAVEPLGPE